MTKIYLANVLFLFFAIQLIRPGSVEAQDFCESKADPELRRLLAQKSETFGKLLYISQLRLARKLAEDHYQRAVLEKEIVSEAKALDKNETRRIKKLALESYFAYGEERTNQEAKELVEDPQGFANDISTATAAHIFNSLDVPCNDDQVCLSKSDEAFAWLAEELDVETGLAKSLGPEKVGKFYLKGGEGVNARARLKKEALKNFTKKFEIFYTNEKVCLNSRGSSCVAPRAQGPIEVQAYGMLSLVSPKKDPKRLDREKHSQAIKKIRGGFGWSKPSEINRAPASVEFVDQRFVCGGEEFYPSVENKKIYGFSNPKGGFNDGSNAFDIYKNKGLKGLRSLSKEKSAFKGKGGGKFSGLKMLNKFSIPGPMFRCTPDNPIVVPKMGFLNADKNVCCDERIEKRKMRYLFFNWGGGMTCRLFFGLPYIAEVGGKLGVGVNLILSGGQEPARCEDKTCFRASPKFNVTAGLYAEALAGAGSIEGTISWLPYASVQQCIMPDGTFPPANLHYQVGRVLAIATVRIGWSFSYNKVKTIYESDKKKTSNFPIF